LRENQPTFALIFPRSNSTDKARQIGDKALPAVI
jgi:hypothetical protein